MLSKAVREHIMHPVQYIVRTLYMVEIYGYDCVSAWSGFGVCCVSKSYSNSENRTVWQLKNTFHLLSVSLACGGSTSNNNSYIVQSTTTTAPATPCTYKVCPCNSDICRIRYDFTTHTLATQTLGTSLAAGAPNAVLSKLNFDCWKRPKNNSFVT